MLGLIILLAFSSIGFGPIPGWWKYDYTEFEPTLTDGGAPTLSIWPPAWGDHPFGQSNEGRDYFALTMRGLQQSLIIAFIVGIVSTMVGTVIGAVSGYFRGRTESVLMRFTDVMITIPLLAIAAVIAGRSAVRALSGSGCCSVWSPGPRWPGSSAASSFAAGEGVRRRRAFGRRLQPADHLPAHPAEHRRGDHGVGDTGHLRRDPAETA